MISRSRSQLPQGPCLTIKACQIYLSTRNSPNIGPKHFFKYVGGKCRIFPCRFHSTGAPLIVKIGKKTAHLHHHWGCTKGCGAKSLHPEKKSAEWSASANEHASHAFALPRCILHSPLQNREEIVIEE
jgi:hypothetical protein